MCVCVRVVCTFDAVTLHKAIFIFFFMFFFFSSVVIETFCVCVLFFIRL